MAVERIDANIQSYISGAQVQAGKQEVEDDSADHARKAAEKKIALKKERIKSSDTHREVFNRQTDNKQKMQQALGGASGKDVADGLRAWGDNKEIQQRLTEAQKDFFREQVAQNPQKAAKGARVLDQLTQQPDFQKAIKDAKQMGVLQRGVVENPEQSKPAAGQMLQSRFMQSPKADPESKNRYMEFGFNQAKKGQLDTVKKAGDMLGSLTKTNTPKTAQRAAVNMAQRNPANSKGMANVDAFVQNPNVGKMPSFARGKATELLAKADGKGEVKEGFEKLAADPKFQTQTAQNKGRFFSTIGTGRPSEYRQLTDMSLQALQQTNFPKRAGQVGKFLGKMSQQVQQGGATAVNVDAAVKKAKSSPLPTPPKLIPTDDEEMDPEELARARSQNRAQVLQYCTKLQRTYEDGQKKLNSAKYLEDVNGLNNLRTPPPIDTTGLSTEDAAFVREREQAVRGLLDNVCTLQKRKARELRTKRMPPAKKRARMEKRRIQGRQPKYFNPNAAGVGASEAFAQTGTTGPTALPSTPAQGHRQTTANAHAGIGADGIQAQVQSAIAQMGGNLTAENAGQVAQVIAQSVTQQVVAQVTAQLTQQLQGAPAPEPSSVSAPPQTGGQQGKVDGWGIPRTFERDLGGRTQAPVQPKESAPSYGEIEAEPYTGKMLIKDPSSVRDLSTLFISSWKDLSRPEMALLKNLGWNQQLWATKDSPAASWPVAMMTPFINLNPTQRESVRKLGFSAHDWDQKVQAFSTGKNA